MAGKIVHFEVVATDAERAKKFYGGLFGWKFKNANVEGMDYFLTEGSDPGGAVYADQGGAKGAPIIYFDTEDIDKSVKKTRELGGKADDKLPIPGQGWFSACVDTEGNKFSLFQNDPSVTMENMPQHEHQETRA
jgi:predicted enzyme related to lactoylglutathione lyase